MLELRGMRSTPSLPSLPGPVWPEMVALERVLSMGRIKLNRGFERLLFFAFKPCIYAKLNCLKKKCFDI